jgi:hypothetical protein
MQLVSWLAECDPAPRRPAHRIDPALMVEIVEHAVATPHGPRTAVSFVTNGLDREVVFTWCGPKMLGTPCAATIAALRRIGRASSSGTALHPGASFFLGEGAFIDGVGLAGVMLIPAQAMPGVAPPPGALHAIAVTAHELEAASVTSSLRVIGRLGVDRPGFPCPPWSTVRPSVARLGEPTILTATRRASIAGLTVAEERDIVEVRVPRASAEALALVVDAPGDGVAIAAELDAAADGLRVWPARGGDPLVIGDVCSRIAGAFVRISAAEQTSAAPLEDGYAIALDHAARRRVGAALLDGRSWRAGDVAFHVS